MTDMSSLKNNGKREDLNNLPSIKYFEYRNALVLNRTSFSEQHHGGRKRLFVGSKFLASTVNSSSIEMGDLKDSEFSSFLGSFTRQLFKMLLKEDSMWDLNVSFKGKSRHKNIEFWDKLEDGCVFFNIDLNSAYWQIAHRLGYVNNKMYEKYVNDDRFKNLKRLCFSFMARKNKKIYIEDGKEPVEIACKTEFLQKIYENVRNELYNTITRSLEGVEYVEYNIDGVSVLHDSWDVVKERFKKEGMEFKTTMCRKIDDKEYFYGKEVKVFKR